MSRKRNRSRPWQPPADDRELEQWINKLSAYLETTSGSVVPDVCRRRSRALAGLAIMRGVEIVYLPVDSEAD